MSYRLIYSAAAVAGILSGCGGGGSDPAPVEMEPPGETIVTKENYVDVAGLSLVAANRLGFMIDLVDVVFEAVIDSGDTPGTYPCMFGGTASYTKTGNDYRFLASDCDTWMSGDRVLISGSMQVANPVVQTTSAAYFLQSAAITFENISVTEAGAATRFSGSAAMSSTVTSPTTAEVQATGSVDVIRAGKTDSYKNVDLRLLSTLNFGNIVTNGALELTSPRAPGPLSLSAAAGSTDTLTATASDGSQAILATSDGTDFAITFATAAGVQESTNSSATSSPLAEAIARALQ